MSSNETQTPSPSASLARGGEMFLHGGLYHPSPLPQAPALLRPLSLYQYRGLWGDTGNKSHLKIPLEKEIFFKPKSIPCLGSQYSCIDSDIGTTEQTEIQTLGQVSCVTLAITRGVAATDGGRISRVQA